MQRVSGRNAMRVPSRRRGFTLIEILVVILIIVVLMAILVPALGAARRNAYVANTKAMLSSLSSNCEAYYTVFHAYPGPMPAGIQAPNVGGTSNASPPKISGAQNLLLGLSYGVLDPNVAAGRTGARTPTSTVIQGMKWAGPTRDAYVDASKPSGPINWASIRPDGSPEQLPAFFTPSAKQLSANVPQGSTTWPNGGVQGINGTMNNFAFPVIVDAFPEGLPVLYYRRVPGGDTPATAYNINENIEYTKSSRSQSPGGLMSTNGSALPQDPVGSGNVPLYPASLFYSSDLSFAMGGSTTGTGGYLLIAAGPARVYGNTGTVAAPKTDNIVQFGGN